LVKSTIFRTFTENIGNMNRRSFYWKCEFKDKNDEVVTKTVYAKTTTQASRYAYEMSVRIGMTPKYETLREATEEEVKEFKKMIKSKISK
jgi:hypothetical protein